VSTETTALPPIALEDGAGEALWFLGGLVTIKAGGDETAGRVAVMEYRAPHGVGSPLHVHRREDEWFYVLDGRLTFWVGGRTISAGPGSFVYGPRDVPHTFEVASHEARFLLVAEPGGFERFVRAASDVAATPTLPPAPGAPPDLERLTALAAENGIDIIGPPGIPS